MLIGHEKQLEFLRNSFKTGKTSHAYLFSGPEKLGKKTLALTWLSELFQKNNNPDVIFQKNNNPDVIFQKNNNPDVILVDAEEEIKISQIRDLIWKLSLKPYSSYFGGRADKTSSSYFGGGADKTSSLSFRAALINNAHLMNAESQNALLKTLEEPKGNVFIFLITDQQESLLPTIISRVQIIKFYSVGKAIINDFLKKKGIDEVLIEEILQISSGRPGVAIDCASDPLKMDLFRKSLQDIKKVSDSDLFFRFQYAKIVSEDARYLKNNLDIWLWYFRSVLLTESQKEEKQRKYPLLKLKNIINNIQKTKTLISDTNVNPKLALESLMLDF